MFGMYEMYDIIMIGLELQPSSLVPSQALSHVAVTQFGNAESVDVNTR